jgi:hypothetical protein
MAIWVGSSAVSPSSMSHNAFCSTRPSVQPVARLPIQAEYFGEQIKAAEHGTYHVAGCHHVLPPVVQSRLQLETGVADSERFRVDCQPWLAPPGGDVVVVQVPVQEAVAGFADRLGDGRAQLRTSRCSAGSRNMGTARGTWSSMAVAMLASQAVRRGNRDQAREQLGEDLQGGAVG